jgi:hypothetical protein
MSTLIKPVSQMISAVAAANADQLGSAIALSVPEIGLDTVIEPNIESTGGWDAYEVWRRLIKDARARRKHPDSN